MRKHKLLTVGVWLLLLQAGWAQKYSNEFLSLGIGAKAQAMGNSTVASVDDVTAAYWNPAALAGMDIASGMEIGAMHAEWFAGIGKFDYLGVAMPLAKGKRAIGITAIRFGIDDIPNTLNLFDNDGSINFDNVVPFSSADYAFMGSYAQQIFTHLGKLYVGGNVKVVHRTIGQFAKAWGFGIDASVQWRHKHWNFGLMARDISNTFNSWTFNFTEDEKKILEATSNLVPSSSLEVTRPQFIFATAYHHQWNKFGLLAELNANVSLDGKRNTLFRSNPYSLDPTLGLEVNYGKFVFLRAGINNLQQEEDLNGNDEWRYQPNLGLGLKFINLRIDYALTDVGQQDQKTYSHVVSVILRLDFNYLKKAVKNANKQGN
ncbi:MAG: hypothetical protein AAFV95_16420 [Bacteroidota bacterium]